MNWGVTLVGLVVGIFVGLSGVGGGSLLTPLLVLFFGVHALAAVGTDLVSAVPMKIAGAIAHARQRTVDWKLVSLLSGGGIPGAILGLFVLRHFQAVLTAWQLNVLVSRALGVTLFVSAAALLIGLFMRKDESSDRPFAWTRSKEVAIPAIGFLVGIVVSLTSIGSGSLTLPLLFGVIPALGLRRLIGSDIAFAALLVPVSAIGHWKLGTVNFPLAFSLLLGSVPGVLIGSKLCGTIPSKLLRPVLAGALVFVGTRLI